MKNSYCPNIEYKILNKHVITLSYTHHVSIYRSVEPNFDVSIDTSIGKTITENCKI